MSASARIYSRVSRDLTKEGLSTAAQVEDGRRICQQRGWTIAGEYIDRSVSASAYGKKPRPEYARLLADLRPGDIVVIREPSRATRKLGEFAELRDKCRALGSPICVDGRTYDMRDSDDRFMLGLGALQAEQEADRIQKRSKRGAQTSLNLGRPNGALPYGYRTVFSETGARTWELHPEHAPVVREIAERLLSGQTCYAVVKDLNARGITHSGRPWEATGLRRFITRPALAGLRIYRGRIADVRGVWPPILTEDEHERLKALFADPGRVHNGRQNRAKHLLSGIGVCGKCGGPVRVKDERYRCVLGHVQRKQAEVDEWVRREVVRVLRNWRANLALELEEEEDEETGELIGYKMPDDDGTYARLMGEARQLQARLDSIKAEVIAGRLPATDLSDARAQLEPQIEAKEQAARSGLIHPALAVLGMDLEAAWRGMDLDERRQLVRLSVEVTILPSRRGRLPFDPESVRVVSRLG
ncbi:recombinase family protein [Nocardia flavorosea]|uniref:Recombinase family protein n=1 Tax=Nocardia flavorosea TaxID=53429 RepID=A0A846YIK8_9NOCA|nr:recombinase family protein [Nocardia flavorosea]NKY57412.1 recombinase family protein [Nocardia flavorosea]